VYYFHDNKGDIIYIGKAKDIKQRVKSHFSGNTHSKKKTLFRTKIHDVTFDKTGSELLAFLLEDQKIKKHYPYFNRTNKKFILNQGLYQYHDQEGYIRLAIGPVGKHNHPVRSFASKGEALQFLLSKSLHAGLCMKLNGIIKNRDCNYTSSTKQKCPICEGNISKEGYNLKVKEALKNTENQETYLVKTKGRSIDEFGIVMIEKGRCLGIGYINANNVSSLDWDSAKENLTPYYDTKDTQAILTQHLKKARVTSHGEYMVYSV